MLLIFFCPAKKLTAQQISPKLLWKYSIQSPIIGSPIADDSCIYFGSTNGVVYSLNKTGSLKWKFVTGAPIRSTPCFNKEKIYVLSGDGNVYCINKSSGKMIWYFQSLTGFIGDTQHDFADYYQSSPTLYKDALFFGSGDGNIYSIDANTGSLNWKYATGGNVHTMPAVSGNKVFAGSFDGSLYALNSNNGELLWKFKSVGQLYFPKGEMTGSPVVAGGLVFAGSRDFNFYALDMNGGYCHWMKSFVKGWALPVTLNDSVIYLGTSEDRSIAALDIQTGNVKWQTNVPFNIFGGCAVKKNVGCFGTLMGKVYGIDLTTGTIKWEYNTEGYTQNHLDYFKADDSYRDDIGTIVSTPDKIVNFYNRVGAVFSTPVFVGNSVIFTSSDGNVYCLGI